MKPEYPAADQIPQLRNLWKASFGDDDAYLDLFFSTAFSPDRCRCIVENGSVTAALYWFDVSCDGAPMAYLYAVATDPDARNRGLCRALMEDTRAILTRRGYAGILLKPADEALRHMYARMGYAPCTTISRQVFEAADKAIALQKIDEQEYARLRRQLLPRGGVIQEGVTTEFLDKQADFYRGEQFLAAVSVSDGEFFCHELLGDICAAPGILKALSCKKGAFLFPGSGEPFASFRPLTSGCPIPSYFGLALE